MTNGMVIVIAIAFVMSVMLFVALENGKSNAWKEVEKARIEHACPSSSYSSEPFKGTFQ